MLRQSGLALALLVAVPALARADDAYLVIREVSTDFIGNRFTGDGLDLAAVSGPVGRFFMEAAVTTLEPGACSGDKPLEHPGEELVFTLDGMLSFEVAGEEYMLRRGDALHFRTDRPHRWQNSGRRPARALWMALRSP